MTELREAGSQFWSRADGRLCLQWYRAGETVRFAPHMHSEFNIVVSLRGAVETTQLGSATMIERGEAMMGSNPGVEHASCYQPSPAGCEAVSLTFTPEVLAGLVAGRWRADARDVREPVFLRKIESRTVLAAAEDIVTEMRGRQVGYESVLEGLANRILVETIRAWPGAAIERMEVDHTPRLSRRDHIRAVEFMRWCGKGDFRMQLLCRHLGMSAERLTRMFRAATGASPASFYNHLLLEEGCRLLEQGGQSVKEIGFALGYRTPSHFTAAFRRQFGYSPLQYRQARSEA